MLFYNFIILMISSLLLLGDAILVMKGKRTANNKKIFSGLAQLVVLAYSVTEIMDDTLSTEYMPLFLVIFIFLYLIMQYYFGTDYSVKVEKPELLIEAVSKAISEVEFSKAEKIHENDNTKFTFPDSKKTIEIKVRDSYVSSTKKVYTVHFKQWFSTQTKREIMRSVEDYLYLYDDFNYRTLSVVSQLIMAYIAIVVSIFLVSAALMEPEQIEIISKDTIPVEIHELTSDNRYTDKAVIENIYTILENTSVYKWRNATIEDIKKVTELEVNYGYPWRTLYVGESNNMILFIDYSEIAERSKIHRIASKIYAIYNKQAGNYYRVYGPYRTYGIYEMLKQ